MTAARTRLLECIASTTKALATRVRAKLTKQNIATVTTRPPDAN